MSAPQASLAGAGTAALEIARARRDPSFFIVDERLEVVSAPVSAAGRPEFAALPHDIREAVRRLLYDRIAAIGSAVAMVGDGTIVRVVPLDGGHGPRYAVFLEAYKSRDILGTAARRFGFTPREVELLELLVRGESTADIALAMSISELTVQQHVKNIGRKTGVSKRMEILAAILSVR